MQKKLTPNETIHLTSKASPDCGLAFGVPITIILGNPSNTLFQFINHKESSKINTSHMVHIKKCLFFKNFGKYAGEKMTYFRYVWSGHVSSVSFNLSLISIAFAYTRFF